MYSHETKIYIALLVAIALIAVFLLFFIITIVSYQKKYQHLSRQLVLTEIRTLEQERRHIAAELHDDFGQILSVIRLQLGTLQVSGAEDREIIRNATGLINDTLTRVRTMSETLMPQTFFRKGSVKGIEHYIREMNRTQLLQIRLFCTEEQFFNSQEKELHLFRIIQELINNTIKHAAATEMDITIYPEKNILHVFTEDNGKGFNHREIMNAGLGSGLRNIHNRVELLNGRIFLQTEPGNGTRFEIQLPLL